MKSILQRSLIVLLVAFSLIGCSRVPAGHVGIKVYLLGGSKGVDKEELGPGRVWVGINEELYLFPTFTQNYVWTAGNDVGSPNDESISFQTSQGLTVNADVGISYRIDPAKASFIFEKYRKGVDEITDIYLRNMVRDSLVKLSSKLEIESVYGAGKSELIENVQKQVQEQVKDIGIIVEKIYWIGELRLPPTVVQSINAKIQATQKAQQRENEIQQAEAEAQIKRTEAAGIADSVLIQAKAQAKANELLTNSISDRLVNYKAIETWDGKLPQITGGAIPFVNIPNASK